MSKSKKILLKEKRVRAKRKAQKTAAARREREAALVLQAQRGWEAVAPACLGGFPLPGTPEYNVYMYFHWAAVGTLSAVPDTANMIKCHDSYMKYIGETMPGSLSEFAAPRVRWARVCVFCTYLLKERATQAMSRVDAPGASWTKAWAEAILFRPDGFRVCWVCASDFAVVGVDPMTCALPEGISTAQAPRPDEPAAVLEWTAGGRRGQKVGP